MPKSNETTMTNNPVVPEKDTMAITKDESAKKEKKNSMFDRLIR